MADDPNRDLLPVRDGSFTETYRSIIAISCDPHERHTVSKINRDDLEDKYLRLLDECQSLKKQCNSQEDKIKRLVTKLLRVSATPRTYISSSIDGDKEKTKCEILKMENNKLRDKNMVLRNQILSHRVLRRSPPQSRRLTICTSSRPTSCRSDSGRLKTAAYHNYINDRNDGDDDDDTVDRNSINKFGEWGDERKELMRRIVELENKLAMSRTENQRDKIAENVEYIRVWRQLKLDREKLIEAEATKKLLSTQISEMKVLLDETTKNNGKISETFLAEKKRLSEIDEQLTRSQGNELREKDEQIRDLMSELKILQQHNSELINLSTQNSQVDVENFELKSKLTESLADNHNLKSAFNIEQTNMKALQAVNEQLLEKLQVTQSHIDNLTIQLTSVQNQYQNAIKNQTDAEMKKKEQVKKIDKQTSTSSSLLSCTCESKNTIDKNSDDSLQKKCQINQDEKHKPHKLSSPTEEIPDDKKYPIPKIDSQKYESTSTNNNFKHETNNLSRDKMLKLLDEAQINTPLNAHSVMSLRQNENLNPNTRSCPNTNYRQSSKSTPLSSQSFSPSSALSQKTICKNEKSNQDIIKEIIEMLVEYQNDSNEADRKSMIIYQSDCQSISDISIIPKQELTCGTFVNSSSSHETYNSYDQNNKNPSSKTHHNNISQKVPSKDMKHLLNHSQSFKKEIIDMSDTNNNFNEAEKYEMTNHDSLLSLIKNIKKLLQDVVNNSLNKNNSQLLRHQMCRPVLKTIQLETGMCCGPYDPMKDQYLKKHPTMEEVPMDYQTTVSPGSSNDCKKSCSLMEADDVVYNSEREQTGTIIDTPNRYSPILVTDREGLVEIHILSLKLSPLVENTLFKTNGQTIERSLTISCEFCGEAPISTSMIKYPDLNFNTSWIYRVSNVDEFLDNISHEDVYLQLHVGYSNTLSYVIAHGKINVSDVLSYPQNKLHYIVNIESLIPCFHNKILGQLSLWIRLSCDINRVKLFMQKKSCDKSDANSLDEPSIKKEKLPINSMPNNNESPQPIVETIHKRKFIKLSDTVPNENYYSNSPDVSNNSQNTEYKESVDIALLKNEPEYIAPLTNQWQPWEPTNQVKELHREEHYTIANANAVLYDRNSDDQEQPTYSDTDLDNGNDAILIIIDRLKLVEKSYLLNHPDFHQLFVDYSFLGKSGKAYETKSVPIPKCHSVSMDFDYVKKFRIDEKNHSKERNLLRKLLSSEENLIVRFIVVSEPLKDNEGSENCIDVGYADLNLRKHVLEKGGRNIFITVKNLEKTKSIGVLKISIIGMSAIRQLLSEQKSLEES